MSSDTHRSAAGAAQAGACLLALALALPHASAQERPPATSHAPSPAFTPAFTPASTPAWAADWGFTLPTLDGDRFVASRQLAGRALINFWGVQCPPCLQELPLLQSLTEGGSGWQVWLVNTDAPAQARQALQRWNIRLPSLRGGQGVASLMRAAGNAQGALPFTVLLSNGRICATHRGAVDAHTLPTLLARCPAQ